MRKAIPGADICQHRYIKPARQLQPPVSIANPNAQAACQAFIGVAQFQVTRVEMRRLAGANGERGPLEMTAGVVNGRNAELSRFVGTVDHPDETLAVAVPGRRKQGYSMHIRIGVELGGALGVGRDGGTGSPRVCHAQRLRAHHSNRQSERDTGEQSRESAGEAALAATGTILLEATVSRIHHTQCSDSDRMCQQFHKSGATTTHQR